MKEITFGPWDWYSSEEYKGVDDNKCGKWMHFFETSDLEVIADICRKAVETNVTLHCKHNNKIGCEMNPYNPGKGGVACFYMECDDIESHKKIITYFLENNLIKRTKAGKLYNISFKLDNQTRAGDYGDKYSAAITLNKFVDLTTGEWISN